MTTAPHVQRVLDRIDREIAACVREAFVHHMFNAVDECARPDGWSRGVTLSRNEIPDTSHDAVIVGIRKMLAYNRLLKRARPGQEMTRAREWWLCGALIAEGRLRRATDAVAHRFAPAGRVMTLDTLIARAATAKAPGQIIRPAAFAREAGALEAEPQDAHAALVAQTSERFRATYMDGWEAGLAAGKTLAKRALINSVLACTTIAIATGLLVFAYATTP